MPAVNDKQRALFAIAESMKKGKTKKQYSPEAARIARSLSMPKIREFSKKSRFKENDL